MVEYLVCNAIMLCDAFTEMIYRAFTLSIYQLIYLFIYLTVLKK